jgi:predicted DsbA family dithiol-disulfide isomerase
VAERLQKEHGAQVDWQPFLLHPEIPPEGKEIKPERRQAMMPALSRIMQRAELDNLPYMAPGKMVYSRLALEATEYAREHGKLLSFHRAVFHKLYGDGQDIGSWEVLSDVARNVGLDADDMMRDVTSGAYSTVVDVQTAKAQRLGLDGVPAYILNDKHAVVGAQPYEVFQRLLEEIDSGNCSGCGRARSRHIAGVTPAGKGLANHP